MAAKSAPMARKQDALTDGTSQGGSLLFGKTIPFSVLVVLCWRFVLQP